MQRDQRLYFRDSFRDARADAIRDAEAFDGIVFCLERLGRFLTGGRGDLGRYKKAVLKLASASPMADSIPQRHRAFHVPLNVLYDQFRQARNAALHEGAFARHLTSHAVQIALLLEDALMADSELVGDFMVRDPVCAMLWQPLSFVRQTMLANSFSYLPVDIGTEKSGQWKLLSDRALATCLRGGNAKERDHRFGLSLADALNLKCLTLDEPLVCGPDLLVSTALADCRGLPILIVHEGRLLGIATPFDLL